MRVKQRRDIAAAPPGSDLHQRADDVAHHVAKEGVRLDRVEQHVAAALQLDYPFNRKQAVILDLEKREVTIKPVAGSDVRQLGWRDESTLIGIAAPTGADSPFRLPEARDIVEIEVGN